MTKPLPVSGTDDSLPDKPAANSQDPATPPRRKAPRRATAPAGTPAKNAPQPLLVIASTPAAPVTDDAGTTPTPAPAPSAVADPANESSAGASAEPGKDAELSAAEALPAASVATVPAAEVEAEASLAAMDPEAATSEPAALEHPISKVAEETAPAEDPDTISGQTADNAHILSTEDVDTVVSAAGAAPLASGEPSGLIDSADVPTSKDLSGAKAAPQAAEAAEQHPAAIAEPEPEPEPAEATADEAVESQPAVGVDAEAEESLDTFSASATGLPAAEGEVDGDGVAELAAAESEVAAPQEGMAAVAADILPEAAEPTGVLDAEQADAESEPADATESVEPADELVTTDAPEPDEPAQETPAAAEAPEAAEAASSTEPAAADPAESGAAAEPTATPDAEQADAESEPADAAESVEPADEPVTTDAPEPDEPAQETPAAAEAPEAAKAAEAAEQAVVVEGEQLVEEPDQAKAPEDAWPADDAAPSSANDTVTTAEEDAAVEPDPSSQSLVVPEEQSPAGAPAHEVFAAADDAFGDEPPFNFDLLTKPEPEAPAAAPTSTDEPAAGTDSTMVVPPTSSTGADTMSKFDVAAFLKPGSESGAAGQLPAEERIGFAWPSMDGESTADGEPETPAPAAKAPQSNVARALAAWTAESGAESSEEPPAAETETGGKLASPSRRSRRRAESKAGSVIAAEQAATAPVEQTFDATEDVAPEAGSEEEPAPAKKQKKERKPRKKSRTFLILAAIVVLVLALGTVLYTIGNDNASTEQTEKDRQAAYAATNSLLGQVNELLAVQQEPAVMDQLSQAAADLAAQSAALDDGMPKGTFSAISSGATSSTPTLAPASVPGVVTALQENADALLKDAIYASKAMGRVFASTGTSQLLRSQSLASAANVQLPASTMLDGSNSFMLATGPECKSAKTPREGVSLDGALRAAAEGEQKAVYAYQVASAHLGGDEGLRGRTLTAKHQDQLESLNAELAARCLPTVTLAAGYALSPDFTAQPAVALAGLESELAATYADLAALSAPMAEPIVATAAPGATGAPAEKDPASPTPTSKAGVTSELREIAVARLLATTRTQASWGGTVAALPGIAAAQ